MNLERRLQLNVALMTVLGALLLGVGQGTPWLPIMAGFAAATSIYFTDVLGWLRFNRFVAHLAMIAAAVYSLSHFFQGNSQQQLVSIANLLLYLQMVLLYQEKAPRVYGQLMVLSLLQVVVAAALNVGVSSGLLLVVYLLVTIRAMLLFFLMQQVARFSAENGGGRDTSQRGPFSFLIARRVEPAPGAPVAVFEGSPDELSRGLVGRWFFRYVWAMAWTTLLITIVLFYAVERHEDPDGRQFGGGLGATVGFSPTIRFDEPGRISESDAVAMRVSLLDHDTNEPYVVFGEPYFAGAFLTDYDYFESPPRWIGLTPERSQSRFRRWPRLDPEKRLVRQEIAMKPTDSNLIFAAFPAYRIDGSESSIRVCESGELIRYIPSHAPIPTEPFRYKLGTTAFYDGWQSNVVPDERDLQPFNRGIISESEFPAALFPNLAKLADRILDDESIDRTDRVQTAHALANYFATSGLYTYSLDQRDVRRNRSLDPTEDFAVNHRTGHCEYFASALAMMLRSQNIPSRIVVGFRGGEYNTVGKFYSVRQRDAHAWVEAYLEPEHITDEMLPGASTRPRGAWLRLDPTPASSRFGSRSSGQGLWGQAGQFLDYVQWLWDDYVLGLNYKQQRSMAESSTSSLGGSLFGLTGEDGLLARWARALGLTADSSSVWWYVWRGGLGLVLVFVIVTTLARAVASSRQGRQPSALGRTLLKVATWISPRLARWLDLRPQDDSPNKRHVAFYERLVGLLEGIGLNRPATQTPREFAAACGGELLDALGDQPAAEVPAQVVELFYRVRFGGAALDNAETKMIEDALDRLEAAVAAKS